MKTFTELELSQAVESECTCGGGGPADKHTCPACLVWHRLMTPAMSQHGLDKLHAAVDRLRSDIHNLATCPADGPERDEWIRTHNTNTGEPL